MIESSSSQGSSSGGSGNSTSAKPTQSAREPGQFRFTPEQIVRAICFHLLDTGISKKIGEQSMKRAIARIERDVKVLVVPRSDWKAMNDPERLSWLLEESHTTVETLPDGTAVFRRA